MSQVAGSNTLQQWRETASYWTKHHDTIRTMFLPLTRALIEQARIAPGQSVIDVAGGSGEPSLTIAQAVGPLGFVMCTDAIAEMVAVAEREAFDLGLKNVKFRQCTADSLPFANDLFDVAVSRLGVMFFPDPLAAVREMLRVIKPEGRIAFAVWGKSDLNPYACVVTGVLSRYVPPAPVTPD
ncbi:MAG TPA: class I SAM-dependent methyltransferase, partial [Pyrinomonadaceae bacterium]|nr:class I SAM-dependent methyltransferase [Pyrinomonadaceae bacterium]